MKWLALHIDTSPAGLEPVSNMLNDLGIDGLVIEDEGDFRQFLENNTQYWDYVDEELEQSFRSVLELILLMDSALQGHKYF